MAHYKMNEADEAFLQIPSDGVMLSAGASGTETWIERVFDTIVRIGVKAVGVATAEGGTLETRIEIGADSASGHDGPAPVEGQLRSSQAVQVRVKAGERVAFKAYPKAENALVLRSVVWVSDLKAEPGVPLAPPGDREQRQSSPYQSNESAERC
jgi:hypothetical protein